ncbi:MAG: MBL fold metallo-hydrolase [Solirubrobacteraceae bacterium]
MDPSVASAREVVPGVWRLRLPLPWDGISHANAYAIPDDDGVVLVDCGSAGHPTMEDALDRALAEAGHRVEDVRLLVGTHAHTDHIGLARTVIARSGCRFVARGETGPIYDGHRDPDRVRRLRTDLARREGTPDVALADCGDTGEEELAIEAAVEPHGSLDEGDRIETGAGFVEVLHTPGHSPSHVCLHQPDAGWLIAGDVLCAAFVPWLDIGYSVDPYAEWQASLRRLAALPDRTVVLPGHGRPITDLAGVVALYRDGLAERMEAVARAMGEAPGGAWGLAARAYGLAADDPDTIWAFDEALAYAHHLRLAGRAERVGDDERRVYRLLPGGAPGSPSGSPV